ncbi:MAG: murein L,D-transpeptidase catalytic domain family protein [Sphingosinicella sp.]
MSITRREMIGGGAAIGALSLLTSPLRAQESGPAISPLPAQPRPSFDSLDPRLLERARFAFERHRSEITYGDLIAIVDFGRASAAPRFYFYDTVSGQVSRHLVAHGRGSDPGHTGFLQYFSNRMGSEATSDGSYVTKGFYLGRYGPSLRLKGLDFTNSNAEARAIVVHTAWYAEPEVIAQYGRLGRSEGCFALPRTGYQEAMSRLLLGRFLYADRIA